MSIKKFVKNVASHNEDDEVTKTGGIGLRGNMTYTITPITRKYIIIVCLARVHTISTMTDHVFTYQNSHTTYNLRTSAVSNTSRLFVDTFDFRFVHS